MKCPHCNVQIFPQNKITDIDSTGFDLSDEDYIIYENHYFSVNSAVCPACKRIIIDLKHEISNTLDSTGEFNKVQIQRIYPISSLRSCPKEVDNPQITQDFIEASSVLNISPKASAALSRRCLQNLLREKAGVTKKDLSKEIQEVIDSRTLPSYLSDSIDAIRNIGNYAAHPLKSTASGEIIEVEPGEAEWALDVLEQLFDFYYVQPAKLAAKRLALDTKLATIGKPPMK